MNIREVKRSLENQINGFVNQDIKPRLARFYPRIEEALASQDKRSSLPRWMERIKTVDGKHGVLIHPVLPTEKGVVLEPDGNLRRVEDIGNSRLRFSPHLSGRNYLEEFWRSIACVERSIQAGKGPNLSLGEPLTRKRSL